MTNHDDTTPHPPGEPEEIGQLFADVFDLVDAEVDAIPDEHVNDRLQQLLWDNGYVDPDDRGEIGIMFDGSRGSTGLADLIKSVHMAGELDKAICQLRALQEEAAQAEARVCVARQEADALHAAAARAVQEAAQVRQQAADIRAGADAYVDTALDRAAEIIADAHAQASEIVAEAHAQAAQLIADAEQQGEVITSTARAGTHRYVTGEGPLVEQPFQVVFVGHGLVGKSTLLHSLHTDTDIDLVPVIGHEADHTAGQALARWGSMLESTSTLVPTGRWLWDVDAVARIEAVRLLLAPAHGAGRLLVAGSRPPLAERVLEVVALYGGEISLSDLVRDLRHLRESMCAPMRALPSCPTPKLIGRTGRTEHRVGAIQGTWWRRYGDLLPNWFQTYVGLESDAAGEHSAPGGLACDWDSDRPVRCINSGTDTAHEVAVIMCHSRLADAQDDEPGLALDTADHHG